MLFIKKILDKDDNMDGSFILGVSRFSTFLELEQTINRLKNPVQRTIRFFAVSNRFTTTSYVTMCKTHNDFYSAFRYCKKRYNTKVNPVCLTTEILTMHPGVPHVKSSGINNILLGGYELRDYAQKHFKNKVVIFEI
jgi:hypothetical protein